MAMDSFYGGRQGASFIIVYRFDAIDTTKSGETFRSKEAAVSTANPDVFLLENHNFIFKDGTNYNNYNWKFLLLDGITPVETTEGSKTRDAEPAEGMVQCFELGGETVDKVNYGEYVIIDPPNKSNPDNGKVFRRGMNFSKDNDNPLAGAEYIGQVCGPKGDAPKLEIDHYDDITSAEAIEKSYTVVDGDLVPGYIADDINPIYNDNIDYKYVYVKDQFNNIIGSVVGFKIPYLMVEYGVESLDPYSPAEIEKDPNFIDNQGKWIHPFYQKWQIKIPRGIHGIDSTDIEIIPTRTRPEAIQAYEYPECAQGQESYRIPPDGGGLLTLNNYELAPNLDISETPEDFIGTSSINGNKWVKCYYENNRIVYVKQEDCYCYIIKYKETDYINSAAGEATYIPIGEKEDIRKVTLSEQGYLTIYYTSSKDKEILNQRINWIKDVDINTDEGNNINQEGQGDQKIHVTYNNNTSEAIGNPLNYIIDAVVSQGNTALGIPYSHLLVYYSDPVKRTNEGTNYEYFSPKLNANVTGWVDLGNVHGDPGTFLILKDVASWNDLHLDGDPNKRWLKPEEIYPADDKHAGWGVTLQLSGQDPQILYYDYAINTWYTIGSLSASTVEPSRVIESSKEIAGSHDPDPTDEHYPSQLNMNGFWFGQVAVKTAY